MAEAGEGEPKRCHCGFWASPQTMNMCSKCYKDHLQNVKAAQVEGSDGPSHTGALLQQYLPELHTPEDLGSQSEEKERVVEESSKGEEGENDDASLPTDRPVQKNKKRCWSCKVKLELAQRELGGCKCGYVFCAIHRLPEQHSCIYDHKEGGRKEALKSMVPASKKIGRSFHRIDSRPE